VGGDFELSELIGYAGDSRLDAIGNNFLATDPNDRGLEPPKFAVEFDTKYNNSLQYCNGAVANEHTRKDPLPDELEKDVVQYVFWGSEDLTGIIPCRDDDETYDDNRHDPDPGEEKWSFNTFADVKSSPAVDPNNGTVYVGSDNGRVYAFDPDDGTVKPGWPVNTGSPVRSSPAIADDGTIYVGSDNGNIYAFNSSGSPKPGWPVNTGGPVRSSPAIATDGTIYVGSDDGNIYAFNSSGSPKPGWPVNTGGPVRSSPAIAADGTIYIGSDDGNMYALDSTGAQKPGWPFNAGAAFSLGYPAIGPDGTIYFSAFNARLYARNPDGTEKWMFDTGYITHSSPAIGLDGTLYVEDDRPWMVFCHEWVQIDDGTMNAVRLSEDLAKPLGEPILLFRASEAPWCRPIRPGKYVTDGPCFHRLENGRLVMLWSSFCMSSPSGASSVRLGPIGEASSFWTSTLM